MNSTCQDIIDKFGGKIVYDVGPDDYIHPAVMEAVDHMVGDDPLWERNPHLASYRARMKAKAEQDKNKLLRTEKDTLQSYLKRMKRLSKRTAKYASS
jgi:hypothetical protein